MCLTQIALCSLPEVPGWNSVVLPGVSHPVGDVIAKGLLSGGIQILS